MSATCGDVVEEEERSGRRDGSLVNLASASEKSHDQSESCAFFILCLPEEKLDVTIDTCFLRDRS